MRHQRHFAEPARAFVGVEHLVQHLLAARGLGLDDPAVLEADRDVVDQRALIGQRLGARRHGRNPPAMRRGEDFLGRDVGVAGDAVLGGRGAAFPFMAVGEADRQVGAGTGIMQRAEALAVEPVGALAQHRIVLPQAAIGALADRRARPRRSRPRACRPRPPRIVGKHQLRPGRARIGDDVPVGVEIDDLFQRRLIGDGIGLAGARDLGRVFARQQHRIVADDGKPRGVVGERLRHALIEPVGGAVEASSWP